LKTRRKAKQKKLEKSKFNLLQKLANLRQQLREEAIRIEALYANEATLRRERWQQELERMIKAGEPKIKFCPAPGPLFLAKLASRNLEGFAEFIYAQMVGNKKQFAIELGRCLDREIDTELFSREDEYLATLLNENEHISYREAAAKMEKLDPEMTEAQFYMRKKRFRGYAQDLHQHYNEFCGRQQLAPEI
jgi:hypothetical protein